MNIMNYKSLIYRCILAGMAITLTHGCKKEEPSIHPGVAKPLTPLVFNPNLTYGTMTDQDGNSYKTIVIGTQTWMAENLRTTKYRNGDPIPNVTSSVEWMELTSGGYCTYNNDAKHSRIYGRLYNEYAAHDTRNIAPAGWHLPYFHDWRTLILYLDPNAVFEPDGSCSSHAGIELKEEGFIHWIDTGHTPGTNSSGFTAVPGGDRDPYGKDNESQFVEGLGVWWSAASGPRQLNHESNAMDMMPSTSITHFAYSVRLIKD
jgi:uncharacterized protein (TIGR02145 family)